MMLLGAPAAAQVVAPDSARPAAADSARPSAADSASARRRVTPRGAFMRSLVLPGWGQSEVGAPERGAIYFALEVGSLWMVYKSHQKLGEAREIEMMRRAEGTLLPDAHTALVRQRLAQREDWITLSVFWLFFSGADAFVAAHLRDFDEHVGITPTAAGGTQLQLSLPVGR